MDFFSEYNPGAGQVGRIAFDPEDLAVETFGPAPNEKSSSRRTSADKGAGSFVVPECAHHVKLSDKVLTERIGLGFVLSPGLGYLLLE